MAEPIAALLGAMALQEIGTTTLIRYSLVFAAGVMTYITADELIPVAHEYGYKHTVSVSLLTGDNIRSTHRRHTELNQQ